MQVIGKGVTSIPSNQNIQGVEFSGGPIGEGTKALLIELLQIMLEISPFALDRVEADVISSLFKHCVKQSTCIL